MFYPLLQQWKYKQILCKHCNSIWGLRWQRDWREKILVSCSPLRPLLWTGGTSQDCPSRAVAGHTTASLNRWLQTVAESFGLHAGISCTNCCWATGPIVPHGVRNSEGSHSSAKAPRSNQDMQPLQTWCSLGLAFLFFIHAVVRADCARVRSTNKAQHAAALVGCSAADSAHSGITSVTVATSACVGCWEVCVCVCPALLAQTV